MPKRKQPKLDAPIVVVNAVEEDHYRPKNWIAREWAPIITSYGIEIYNVLLAAANTERKQTGYGSWHFSIRTLAGYLMIDEWTVVQYTWLMEVCGLIQIESGDDKFSNEYTVLTPPRASAQLFAKIVAILDEPVEGLGKKSKWHGFKKRAVDRINRWKPLDAFSKSPDNRPQQCLCPDCSELRSVERWQIKRDWLLRCSVCGTTTVTSRWLPAQPDLFSNTSNGSKPEPATETEPLVQKLVTRFAENKPKLTTKGAKRMVVQYGAEAVERQLDWLHLRDIPDNPLKTLRAALKGSWSAPKTEPEPAAWHDGQLDSDPQLTDHQPPAAEPDPTLAAQWAEVLEQLQTQMTAATFDGWLKNTTLVSVADGCWVVGCETSFVKDWLENRLIKNISRTVQSVAGAEVELEFVVREKVV